jgi:hypothetical protein
VTTQKYHELLRTAHQHTTEIDDLKKNLSEAQNAIYEERKHLLRVISENDELKGSF